MHLYQKTKFLYCSNCIPFLSLEKLNMKVFFDDWVIYHYFKAIKNSGQAQVIRLSGRLMA